MTYVRCRFSLPVNLPCNAVTSCLPQAINVCVCAYVTWTDVRILLPLRNIQKLSWREKYECRNLVEHCKTKVCDQNEAIKCKTRSSNTHYQQNSKTEVNECKETLKRNEVKRERNTGLSKPESAWKRCNGTLKHRTRKQTYDKNETTKRKKNKQNTR